MKGWIIFVLAVVIYGVSIFGGFVQDDVKVIAGDPEMGEISSLVSAFVRPYYYMDEGNAGAYRPLTSFSLYLNALITGKEPWGFHLVNVFFYAGVCVLVFELLKKLDCYVGLPSRNDEGVKKMAFWGALVFAVLPIHTEVVNNIVGRSEMLSLGFVLLAVLMQIKKKWELSALIFLLALFSKETAMVGLPVLIYLLIVGKEKKDLKIGVISFYVLVTIGYLVLRMVVLGNGVLGNNATVVENPLKYISNSQRMMNAVALVPFGIGKIIFPLNLSYDYSFNQLKLVNYWFDWRVILGIGMMILSCVYLYRLLRRDTPRNDGLVVGLMMFWGPLAVTGNFLFPVGTIFGERLWFWPSLGFVMVAVCFFKIFFESYSFHSHSLLATGNPDSPAESGHLDSRLKFSSSKKPSNLSLRSVAQRKMSSKEVFDNFFDKQRIGYVALFIVVLFAGRTFVRNLDWLSQERLFIHDASYAKDSVMAQSNAAAMCLIKKDLMRGKEYLDQAERIYPKYPELMNNWGMYYLWIGEPKMAKEKFEFCLDNKPEFYLCESNMKLLE